MIDIDQRRQLQQPSRRHRVETTLNSRCRGAFCKIEYGVKYRAVWLTRSDGMTLAAANQFDGPVELGQERLDNRRLANAGLTADQHQLTATGLCRRQGGPQRSKLSVPPDKVRRRGHRRFRLRNRLYDLGDEPVTAAVHGTDYILAGTVVTGCSSRTLDA